MPSHEELVEQLRDLYATLPSLDCNGSCWNACGAIDASPVERAQIASLGVTIPVFTEEAAARWDANEPDYCPAFSMGGNNGERSGCKVYDDRPMICRLWGLSADMRCPQGCEPTRVLSSHETFRLLFKAMRIGQHPDMDDRLEADFMSLLDDPEFAADMHAYVGGDRSLRTDVRRHIRSHSGGK